MTLNTSNIAGNSNNLFQGLTAGGDITIIIGKDLPVEVKQQKESLNVKLNDLKSIFAIIEEKLKNIQQPGTFNPPEDDDVYNAIQWDELLDAIEFQGCVLFIGPEISVNSQGKSLHHEFYIDLSKGNRDIEYLENEGYFSPESDEIILYKVLKYYSTEFPKKNIAGRKILEQLAQVPFSLIISLCPDDTIHRVFTDYELNHRFLAYDDTKPEVEPMSNENPVLYNILGNAAGNGKYIFTHKNFYDRIKNVYIPPEIKKKIKDASHYLFIGFDFNKWYNRLLLFILDFDPKKRGVYRMSIGNKDVNDDIERFIEQQYNITFIDNDFNQFIEWLIQNVKNKGKLRKLNQDFLVKNYLKLTSLSAQAGNEDDLDALRKTEAQLGEIEKNIRKFEQIISG